MIHINKLIECDSCNKHIASSQVQLKDTTFKPGKQKRTWQCPYCNAEHLVIVTDKRSRRMMKENKEDRERIAGIHRKAKLLTDAGKLSKEQADKNLQHIKSIGKRIDERTKELDERSRKLMDEYILSLKVD